MKRSPGQIYARLLVFLGGFLVLVVVVSSLYLIPMLEARREALLHHADHPTTQDTRDFKILSAYAVLLLTILLVVLIIGLTLVLRMSRLFSAQSTGPHPPTRHVDVWSEAGKRLDASSLEEPDDADDADDFSI
jgi:hypothetical protein